jgi:hypothetical protein
MRTDRTAHPILRAAHKTFHNNGWAVPSGNFAPKYPRRRVISRKNQQTGSSERLGRTRTTPQQLCYLHSQLHFHRKPLIRVEAFLRLKLNILRISPPPFSVHKQLQSAKIPPSARRLHPNLLGDAKPPVRQPLSSAGIDLPRVLNNRRCTVRFGHLNSARISLLPAARPRVARHREAITRCALTIHDKPRLYWDP